MSFDGTQYVRIAYHIPIKVEAQDISLRFRTSRPDGLFLLMIGMSNGNGKEDLLEISLEMARVKVRMRLGNREKVKYLQVLSSYNAHSFIAV